MFLNWAKCMKVPSFAKATIKDGEEEEAMNTDLDVCDVELKDLEKVTMLLV